VQKGLSPRDQGRAVALRKGLEAAQAPLTRLRHDAGNGIERMTIQRMDHVGVVVEDLEAAAEFFVALGLEVQGRGEVEDERADRIVGLDGVRSELVMMQAPDGQRLLELVKFHSPSSPEGDPHAPAHAPGIRHIAFVVDDVDAAVAGLRERGTELVGELVSYGNSYRLCYVRGPEGIIVELAEPLG
jgi:catechol 2,3-dioxygenase-like lactoylglutathione lyase family enzyme